ncbi:MAG: sigma factor-like helix-turn-helix DNA-binding protein [Propionibacteriaceae bacterium]|nr:sigma factor-like helix-turn-helix DNA-binding protein [Propionibacteriaceae bacterium]
MKKKGLSSVWAVNVDQRRSRRGPDRVEAALAQLDTLPGLILGFDRTAGDEFQGLLAEGSAIVELVVRLARLDALSGLDDPGWRIGIGFGDVEDAAVTSTRAARGSAYIAARQAVVDSARAPAYVALRTAHPADADRGLEAETALVLLRTLLTRRTDKGWVVVDALTPGAEDSVGVEPQDRDAATQAQVAQQLGVSESAVSQRLARALWREGVRGAELATRLLDRVQAGDPQAGEQAAKTVSGGK